MSPSTYDPDLLITAVVVTMIVAFQKILAFRDNAVLIEALDRHREPLH